MKKSTRALVGILVIDGLLIGLTAWLMGAIYGGSTTVSKGEAAQTVLSLMGGVIGVVTAVLLFAWYRHRKTERGES